VAAWASESPTEPGLSQSPDSGAPTVTSGLLDSKLKEVEAATDLDDASKAKLTELYRKALSNIEARKSYDAKAAAYAKSLEDAPTETARLHAETESKAAPTDTQPVPPETPLPEIEQLLAKRLADITFEETRIEAIDQGIEAGAKRPGEARARLVEVKSQFEQLDAELNAPPTPDEATGLTEARRWALQTARNALRAEALMLDQELASLGARAKLATAQRDRSALTLKTLKQQRESLETAANERRRTTAARARAEAQAAELAATNKHPLVQDMARHNSVLGEELTELAARLDDIDDQRSAIQSETKRIAESYTSARERLEAGGGSSAVGQLLADKRGQIPDLRSYRRAIAKRDDQIAEATLAEIRYREELRVLREQDAYLEATTATIPEADRTRVQTELKPLIERRVDLLESLQNTAATYGRGLADLNFAATKLLDTADAYDEYLSERLLWVRSVLPFSRASIAGLPGAVAWLLSPRSWWNVVESLAYQATHAHGGWVLFLAILVLTVRRSALRRAVLATAEPLRRIRTDRFSFTLKAIALSALVAAPASLLLALTGWELAISVEATPFTKSVGRSLFEIAVVLYYLRSFRVLCMPGGVADKHFRWPSDVLAQLRRNFDWLVVFMLPVGFVAQLVYFSDEPTHSGSLGRIAVMVLLIGMAVFFARLLHPKSGPLKYLLANRPDGWANRLRHLWYPLVVGIPLALVGLTLTGYLHTAGTLLQSIIHSLWLALGLIVAHQAIARWLLVTRRSLALEGALERAAARKTDSTKRATEDGEAVQVEEPKVDLASLDHQTRKLVGALVLAAGVIGLWMVWSEVLPAFTFLEHFSLWHHTGVVNGQEQQVPVTLADLLLVLTTLAVATIAGRNLPALFEILLLQYTQMSSGSRYTATTLTSYVITASAFLLIFSTLGMSWSQVQWLVAALSVGIGFGLQEIVANFISGLIILFERPVRVGDIITIGGTTGTVSKIQIRATTIRNYDQQELLVPNKQFITGELLNWSLSDQVNRIIITVGVEYGADTRVAMALLAEAAREHPRVLKDPAPVIAFEGFGDNALTLTLRCYLGALDGRLGVATELHQGIYDKLTAAGIGIAFPQRDVHLTTNRPLDVRIQRHPDESPPGLGSEGH